MEVLLIHEVDLEFREQMVIGVADSIKNADKMINKYYGEHEATSWEHIGKPNLEYVKTIKVKDWNTIGETYKYDIWLERFKLNKI